MVRDCVSVLCELIFIASVCVCVSVFELGKDLCLLYKYICLHLCFWVAKPPILA